MMRAPPSLAYITWYWIYNSLYFIYMPYLAINN